MLRRAVYCLASITAVGAIPCAARNPGDPFHPGFNLFSRQQDVQLGLETSQEVRKKYEAVPNPFLQGYLKRVGERLAASQEAKESGFNFQFTLVNEPSVNAFALPGGPMFVFTGLLKAVDNEAQLAGVMSHEMSHVILRHGTNQLSKANVLQLPAALAGAAAGNGTIMGQLTQAGIGFGLQSALLKFSRSDETQADLLGSHLMAETGYNPVELGRFFEKLEASAGKGSLQFLSQFLSDHPNPGNRTKAIEVEITGLPSRSYGYQTGEFAKAKTEVVQVPAPRKQPQPPANRFR
jgi:predicted Zn-dependent protease